MVRAFKEDLFESAVDAWELVFNVYSNAGE